METEEKARGFGMLATPCCGEAIVCLNLDDALLYCGTCGTDLDRKGIGTMIERWKAALAWLDTMPGRA